MTETPSNHHNMRAGWFAALLIAIVILGGCIRFAALAEVRDVGFYGRPVSDAGAYVTRARQIMAGDWKGPASYVHAPLYPIVLAAAYGVWDDPDSPRFMQIGFSMLSCALLAMAAARFFDRRAALVAALLLALYPPAIFFDLIIQKAGLALLLSCALLFVLAAMAQRGTWWKAGAAGILLGLLILTRQNALAFVPLILLFVVIATRGGWLRRMMATGVCAAALGATLLPWMARNAQVIDAWVLSTPNLGQNFAMGNHPDATGTYLPSKRGKANAEYEQAEWVRAAERATGREMSAQEVSDYYLDAAMRYIKAEPREWLRLTLRKWWLTWGAYELPDTEDYYLYQEHSRVLRWLDVVLHFGVVCPLAVVGLSLMSRRWKQLWVLYGWLLIGALAVAAFVVFARYRMPLIPVVLMFAAAGLVEGIALGRSRRVAAIIGAVLLLGLSAVFVNWPIHARREPQAVSYVNHAVVLADGGELERALAELDKAFALEPENADAHAMLASVQLERGEYDAAMQSFERAKAADPLFAGAYVGIGNVLLAQGDRPAAVRQFQTALQLDPDHRVARNQLAATIAQQDRPADALPMLLELTQDEPEYPEAFLNLGNVYLMMYQPDEAIAAYERALELRPQYAEAGQMIEAAHEMQRKRKQRQ